jgi:hypothetical protein
MAKHKSPLVMQRGGAPEFFSQETITKIFSETVVPNFQEQIRLLPDSLIVGSAILAFCTQSFAMSIFFLTMLETAGLHAGLQYLFSYLDPARTLPTAQSSLPACKSGFLSPTLESISLLGKQSPPSSFPSSSLFFLSTASAYILGGFINSKSDLEALGKDYAARFYIALFSTLFFLLLITTYRMFYNCDSAGIAIVSILFGLLVGVLLYYQNLLLLGRNSTNLLGIPLLVNRTADKKPIYVCPTQT